MPPTIMVTFGRLPPPLEPEPLPLEVVLVEEPQAVSATVASRPPVIARARVRRDLLVILVVNMTDTPLCGEGGRCTVRAGPREPGPESRAPRAGPRPGSEAGDLVGG